MQSVWELHFWPDPHFLLQIPPQSTSLSLPSLIPSTQPQVPFEHVSPVEQTPQLMLPPQPSLWVPQLPAPQVFGVQQFCA